MGTVPVSTESRKVPNMPNYLTLGELRAKTAGLPDSVPIIATTADGGWWLNLEVEPYQEQDEALVLATRDDFDTRQW